MQAAWNDALQHALSVWRQLPADQQWLAIGTATTLFFLACLYWTPLGNRAAATKCMMLAVAVHLLAWGYALQADFRGPEPRPERERRVSLTWTESEPRQAFPALEERVSDPAGQSDDIQWRRAVQDALERAPSEVEALSPNLPESEDFSEPVELARSELPPADLFPAEEPAEPLREAVETPSEAPEDAPLSLTRQSSQVRRRSASLDAEPPSPLSDLDDAGPLAALHRESVAPRLPLSPSDPELAAPAKSRRANVELRADPLTVRRQTKRAVEPLRPRLEPTVDAPRNSIAAVPSTDSGENSDLPTPSIAARGEAPSSSAIVNEPFLPAAGAAGERAAAPRVAKTSSRAASGLSDGEDPFALRRSTGSGSVRRRSASNQSQDGDPVGKMLARGAGEDLQGRGGAGRDQSAPLAPMWQNRTASNRLDLVIQFGGSQRTEQAVEDALSWLAAHQNPAGFWDSDRFFDQCPHGDLCSGPAVETGSDTGLTGLSLLAFLGAGHTHQNRGEFAPTVRSGLTWLVRQQRSDGDLRGQGRIYCHAMATLALTEAYAMTKDDALRRPAQSAISWLARAQHPESGGWRYGPGQYGDTSVYGWCVLALRSADRAGLSVPSSTWTRAKNWLPLVSSGPNGGLTSYRPGDLPSEAMTAEAMVCRQIFGADRSDPVLDEAGDYLLRRLPAMNDYHLYYWYYGTLSMFQLGGTHWQRWNESLSAVLLDTQRQSGHAKGSWDPQRPFGIDGGRVFTTACSALCLEVYYRYVPLYATSGKADGAAE